MADDMILALQNVTKTYPGVVAMDNVSMSIKRGEIHALVGENGAGKSTLIKTITGAITPDSGTIEFDGKIYEQLTPKQAQMAGIAAIYQELLLAPQLTVAENIYMGQRVNEGALVNHRLVYEKAKEVLTKLESDIDPKMYVRELSVAYKEIVEIAKAVAKDAKFLIMDEPTAPLTDDDVEILMATIRSLNAQGITILYISHRLEEIFQIADRVTVMRDGQYITTQNIGDVDKAKLIYYMVGRELNETFPQRNIKLGETALEVKNLSGAKNKPISFSVHYGEIIGLGGLVGAGRTELVRMIFGADPIESGEIFVDGKPVVIEKPLDAVSLGMALVPEDRKQQGVILRASITANIIIPLVKKIAGFLGIVDVKKESEIVQKQVDNLQIHTPSNHQLVTNLSGGNQQKVALGKWLATDSKILILDEPTRGIDVGAKQEVYRLINALAEEGKAIIVISSEMEEILGITDRMLILHEGEFSKELSKHEYTQERVLHYASGEKGII